MFEEDGFTLRALTADVVRYFDAVRAVGQMVGSIFKLFNVLHLGDMSVVRDRKASLLQLIGRFRQVEFFLYELERWRFLAVRWGGVVVFIDERVTLLGVIVGLRGDWRRGEDAVHSIPLIHEVLNRVIDTPIERVICLNGYFACSEPI